MASKKLVAKISVSQWDLAGIVASAHIRKAMNKEWREWVAAEIDKKLKVQIG